jgi:hypothetical protein
MAYVDLLSVTHNNSQHDYPGRVNGLDYLKAKAAEPAITASLAARQALANLHFIGVGESQLCATTHKSKILGHCLNDMDI